MPKDKESFQDQDKTAMFYNCSLVQLSEEILLGFRELRSEYPFSEDQVSEINQALLKRASLLFPPVEDTTE